MHSRHLWMWPVGGQSMPCTQKASPLQCFLDKKLCSTFSDFVHVYKWILGHCCWGYPWAGLASIPEGLEKYSCSGCFMLRNPGLSWPDGQHDLLCMCMPAGLMTFFFFTKTSSSARREIRTCTRHSSRQ